jgi:hypothetical protein
MRLAIAVAVLMTAPFTANAQGRGHDGVPPGQMPPPGSCRIWFDGLPPGHEPLPTDCQTAYRDAPPDARVLVGASVGARDDDGTKGDHGRHGGRDKGRGHKHDDEGSGECLAYAPDGACAEVYAPAGGPVVLPDMVGAVFAREGRVWPEVQRWLGGLHLTVHVDATVAGRPTRVRWTDSNGALVQEWIDTNGDGRAEVVRVYRRGVLIHTYNQNQ